MTKYGVGVGRSYSIGDVSGSRLKTCRALRFKMQKASVGISVLDQRCAFRWFTPGTQWTCSEGVFDSCTRSCLKWLTRGPKTEGQEIRGFDENGFLC